MQNPRGSNGRSSGSGRHLARVPDRITARMAAVIGGGSLEPSTHCRRRWPEFGAGQKTSLRLSRIIAGRVYPDRA
jgi:hypothetical protein